MKDCALDNIDVIEIGGGYGGLCFFIYSLAHLFQITIKTYAIFDLALPSQLQKKYLHALNVVNGVSYLDLNCISNLSKNSFLISNYAFSEISRDLQQRYTNNVINPFTSHGFLVWNFIDFYEFVDNSVISHEPEFPVSANNNLFVQYKPVEVLYR